MSKNDIPPVILPVTTFKMRAGLSKLEPELLQRWDDIKLWKKIRQSAVNKPKFILHDGPPYANGNIHLGTALNKVLKDLVNRSKNLIGFNANFIPGWDCHGLPIEWKVEENFRKQGKNKQDIDINEFRNECRQFALKWLEIQKLEFKRLGVLGHWDKPYKTMSFSAEAKIVSELSKLIVNDSIYRNLRPVLWSIVEKTALAEAEIEYHNIKSTAIYVSFPINADSLSSIKNGDRFLNHSVIIWTTTTWTIPANRLLACHKDLKYVRLQVNDVKENYEIEKGKLIIIAENLVDAVCQACGIESFKILETISGIELSKIECKHPFGSLDNGYNFTVPIVLADFVSSEQGTGIVHIAPSHGGDDFEIAQKRGMKSEMTVDDDGFYTSIIPLFAGLDIYDKQGKPGSAISAVLEALIKTKSLLKAYKFKHDYPHSWRSKTPLIFRLTNQWFVALDNNLDNNNSLREQALNALNKVTFHPHTGKDRLSSMVRLRPDWCISRQRSWGVPLPLFVHKKNKTILKDKEVFHRIYKRFEKEGADAWFSVPASEFLSHKYNADDYEQIFDVVDVWFDSGSSHAFVLENNPELTWPADLYLEGSDQHRGWFQSSLLQSVGTRGKAPYKAIMTHGFVVDKKGVKLSKSLGNFPSTEKIIKMYGAEILRLWISGSDFFDDIRFDDSILKQQMDIYRRFRNTLRWLLGVLHDEKTADIPNSITNYPKLEQLILHRLSKLVKKCKIYISEYRFMSYTRAIFDFCNDDLSAFYFDIRKDLIYCGKVSDVNRQQCIMVMGTIFDTVVKLLSPILCFTTEEAWLCIHKDVPEASVHLQTLDDLPWINNNIENSFKDKLRLRSTALHFLEEARKKGSIRSSLEASIVIKSSKAIDFHEEELADLFIVSQVSFETYDSSINKTIDSDIEITVLNAEGEKCQRCWKFCKEVKDNAVLCHRCESII